MYKTFLVLVCLGLVFSGNIFAQEPEDSDSVYLKVDQPPSFPGGESQLIKYLSDNIVYPPIERDYGIQGLVVVSYVVEKDGSITNIKILKGVTPNINNEAMRVVKGMPAWIPGYIKGKPVRVNINLPIRFALSPGNPIHKKKKKRR